MNVQTQAWAGEFGDHYSERSPGDVQANSAFFARILGVMADDPQSVIEFGCGVGSNLRALRELLPAVRLDGVEVNAVAAAKAAAWADEVHKCSLLDWFVPRPRHHLSFTKGVLIHIAPENLSRAYAALYGNSKRYVLVAEYYSPKPVEVMYRGQAGLLWKRDFAGELMDAYPDLRLVDYGFVYHRDPHPQDDLTWFLMEKRP